MGNYRSEPLTDKETATGVLTRVTDEGLDLSLTFASASMQGWRQTMEDTLVTQLELPNGESFFAVFDGHGGKEVAQFCKEEILGIFTSLASYE